MRRSASQSERDVRRATSDAAQAAVPTAGQWNRQPGQLVNALVASDSAVDRRVQQTALESLGYSVKLVNDVARATKFLSDVVNCELVVADWDVRLIVVAPIPALSMMPLALKAGVDDILVKPYGREALLQRARSVAR